MKRFISSAKKEFVTTKLSTDLMGRTLSSSGTFLRDNSGVTLAGEVIGTTLNAGNSVKNFVLSPFRGKKEEKKKN